MISVSKAPLKYRFDKTKNNRFETLWFRPSVDLFCQLMCSATWSPITWRHGTRYKWDTFQWCTYLALDFDEGFTLAECRKWVEENDYAAIVGASKSHGIEKVLPSGRVLPACDRFRVVIPFETTIRDPELYGVNMLAVMADRPETDQACKDTKRLFFPCKSILFTHPGRRKYPVVDFPVDYTSVKTRNQRSVERHAVYREKKTVHGDVIAWLRYGAPRGMGNKCCFEAGRKLTLSGFSEDEILDMVSRSKLSSATDYIRGVLQGIAYGEKALAGQ